MNYLKKLCLSGVLAVVTLGAPAESRAASGLIDLRGNLTFGPWTSTFTQGDGNSHSVDLTSNTSLGTEYALGIGVGPGFIEYNLAWFMPQHFFRDGDLVARDVVYYSLIGFNLGLDIPILPVEVYLGYERGNYRFSSGTATRFGGTTLKAGAVLNLVANGHVRVGVRGEFRRMSIGSDDAGSLPDSLNAHANLYLLGLTFGVK